MKYVEHVSGNIFIRPCFLPVKGASIPGHTHNFDHTTFVVSGSIHVRGYKGTEEKVQDFRAGEHFLVLKDWTHEITALEDETRFYCIYAHRSPQGEVVQESTGWLESQTDAYN